MRVKVWAILFAAAFGCAISCLALIYVITVTKNLAYEPILYVLILLSFILAAGGYLLELRYKKEHPDEFQMDLPDENSFISNVSLIPRPT